MNSLFPELARPRLLVSVRSLEEARLAVQGGADVIDLKEPARGSLGPVSLEVIDAVAGQLPADRAVTAALGEWSDDTVFDLIANLPRALALVKVGVAGLGRSRDASAALEKLAQAVEERFGRRLLVPTAYADAERCAAPPIEAVLEEAIAIRAPFLMVDTGIKDGQGFWDFVGDSEYRDLRAHCRSLGMSLAMAGSLDERGIDRLCVDPPEVIAVRGAACEQGDRVAAISRARVVRLMEIVRGLCTADLDPRKA